MVAFEKEHFEIAIGGFLLVVSFLISLFMVIGVLEPSFSLSILAFSASLAGLLLGFHGLYGLIFRYRRKQ